MLNNLEFKYPTNTLYLVLAIAAVVFFILSFKKKERILAVLRLGYELRLKALRAALLSAGLALMVFSLLGPQIFSGYQEISKTGMDIYVLIDTSKSMLVTDVKPDRITIAKKIVGDLLGHLEGDRIGFIPFASDAYIQMPLTGDYQLAAMFLDVIDTDMIGGGGTNLAAAIKLANDSFTRTSSADKVILIISDGEEHDDASQNALKGITDASLKIYTVGVGTDKGGLVPVYNDAGDTVVDYMKDGTGNPVTSRLNSDNLVKLSQVGKGSYYQASSQSWDSAALMAELSHLKRDELALDKISKFQPLYQYFLAPGLLLAAAAWFLPERRKTA